MSGIAGGHGQKGLTVDPARYVAVLLSPSGRKRTTPSGAIAAVPRPARSASAVVPLGAAVALAAEPAPHGHYMFAWAGDPEQRGEDFIAVIDADPASPHYGELLTSAASGITTRQVHHTEYWMPDSGQLFANDHRAGDTVIFDLTEALKPSVRARFHDLAGFSHPHSFLRLPNGHVLASFQFEGAFHHAAGPHDDPGEDPAAKRGVHGGIVEIDDDGRAVRAAATADAAHADSPLMAYSLVPLPDLDRVLVTNSGMRGEDPTGHTYQMFRLSDLKLLSTNAFDPGPGRYGEIDPEEARRGPDGAVYVQTVGCGVERVSELTSDRPVARLVYQFPGSSCGVPSVVGRYWIQSVQLLHAIVVLDFPRGARRTDSASLDGLRPADAAPGGVGLRRGTSVHADLRPRERCAGARSCLPRWRRESRIRYRVARLAARLDGRGAGARHRIFEMTRAGGAPLRVPLRRCSRCARGGRDRAAPRAPRPRAAAAERPARTSR